MRIITRLRNLLVSSVAYCADSTYNNHDLYSNGSIRILKPGEDADALKFEHSAAYKKALVQGSKNNGTPRASPKVLEELAKD